MDGRGLWSSGVLCDNWVGSGEKHLLHVQRLLGGCVEWSPGSKGSVDTSYFMGGHQRMCTHFWPHISCCHSLCAGHNTLGTHGTHSLLVHIADVRERVQITPWVVDVMHSQSLSSFWPVFFSLLHLTLAAGRLLAGMVVLWGGKDGWMLLVTISE